MNTVYGKFRYHYRDHRDEVKEHFAEHYRGDPSYFNEIGCPVLLEQAEGHTSVIAWRDYNEYR